MHLWPVQRVPDGLTDRWSAPFGVWLGVPVRLHGTWALVLAVAGWYAFQSGSYAFGLGLAVYLASVVAHELSHAVAAWRIGGLVEGVVLGPTGGLCPPRLPKDPEARVFVAMAGPVLNLTLVVVGAICLAAHNESLLPTLWSPGVVSLGVDASHTPAILLAKMMVWINGPLFLLNMLPAFPFDGGNVVRALLWPWLGRSTADQATYRLALLTGAGLFGTSALLTHPMVPSEVGWLGPALIALSVLVLFGAYRDRIQASEERRAAMLGLQVPLLGAPGNYGWDEVDESMVLVESRQATTERDESEESADDKVEDRVEDSRVDEILAKLHDDGIDRLSQEDREVLQRASRRYRRRRTDEWR